MQYFKICKYDYDNPDYVNEWMTGNELLCDGQVSYPVDYYLIERDFINIACDFLSLFKDGDFTLHHYQFFIEDDYFSSYSEKVAAFSNLLINVDVAELTRKEFQCLSFEEKLLIFQLSLRGVAQVGIKDVTTGACFSDMSDGFYWFLALPDDVLVEQIVKPYKCIYVYEWYDIWSDD